jgi:uncharacterized C2H2 Zn-finger protein
MRRGRITELENQNKESTTSKDTEISNLKTEVANLTSRVEELKNKNEELTKSLSERDLKLEELNKSLEDKEKIIGDQKAILEKAETELSALKPAEPVDYSGEERLVCPRCGAVGKDIKSEEDRNKVLGYVGHKPMYGKKNVCKKCGYDF